MIKTLIFEGLTTFKSAVKNKDRKYPDINNIKNNNLLLKPYICPKFKFTKPLKIFTIGSCFARNIEIFLKKDENIYLPTLDFSVPYEEWPHKEISLRFRRANDPLCEYTPGCIRQRILNTVGEFDFDNETIIEENGKFFDLLLLNGVNGTSYERCIERRQEISNIYKHLLDSDLLLITLGYIESWALKDGNNLVFLNRFPGYNELLRRKDRYFFIRLGLDDSVAYLEEALINLKKLNRKLKILLTVSPVPISATFMPNSDCIISNNTSKSILILGAKYLSEKYPFIDYFPSYEIVMSIGNYAFKEDLVHVKEEIISEVISYFIEFYFENDEDILHYLKLIQDKNIAIFGLGKSGKMTYDFIKRYYPEKIKYFIDDNVKGDYEDIPIVTTDEFLEKYQNNVDIVVFGKYQHLNPNLLPNLKIPYLRLENIQ
jgi:hypothetical protein